MPETAIVPAATSALATPEAREVGAFYHEQFSSGEWRLHDLVRVRVPGGGGRTWEVPDPLDPDNPASMQTLTGIIIATIPSRIRYHQGFEERGEAGPPDCQSNNMSEGYGKPYPNDTFGKHACGTCPANQWGSADRGKGKACGERRHLVMLVPEIGKAPVHVDLGASSIKAISDYTKALVSGKQFLPIYRAVTELKLTQREMNGIKVATVSPRFVGPLADPDAIALVDAYRSGDPSFIDLCRDSLLGQPAADDDE